MGKSDKDRVQRLLILARDLAGRRTDAGLLKASEVLLHAVDEGSKDPEVMVTAARYLLESPCLPEGISKARIASLVDEAISQDPADLTVLENAVFCYELLLNDFPHKLEDILRVSLTILDLNPDSVEAMITLANHRKHYSVSLSLADAIRMLEWAKEVEPGNVLVNYTLARLYNEAGRYNKARVLYRQINAGSKPELGPATSARSKRRPRYRKN